MTACASFLAGRLSALTDTAVAPPSDGRAPPTLTGATARTSPAPTEAVGVARAGGPATEVLTPRPTPASADPASQPPAVAQASEPVRCETELAKARSTLAAQAEQRVATEGTPVAPLKSSDLEPRFNEGSLLSALQQAFTQSKVPGTLGGVDCSEYPCLVFGRIRGSEDFMERLERTRPFAAYEEDIMVALMWTATDEADRPRVVERGEAPERVEQTLFSIALYPRTDRARFGENLDRRIRARTSALWNTTTPFDETGR